MPEADAAVKVRIYIKPAQHRQLKELAASDDLSVSWLIRRAIDEYLARRAAQREEEK